MKHSFNHPNCSSLAPSLGAWRPFLLVVIFFVAGNLRAQNSRHYLHFDVGGGIHDLNYSLSNGTVKAGYGYLANMGYSYFFSAHWGLQTGAGIQSFGTKSTINGIFKMSAVDSDGDSYEFRSNYTNWQEEQQALFVDVPLKVQYRHFFNNTIGILVSVGGKVSFPLSANYKTTGGELKTTGYYSQWNVELYDLPLHGFSNYTNTFSDDLSLKTSYSAIADMGYLANLSKKVSLYLGGYLNYGFTSVTSVNNNPVYQSDGTYNGVLSSNQAKDVTPIAFGIKAGLYWKMGR